MVELDFLTRYKQYKEKWTNSAKLKFRTSKKINLKKFRISAHQKIPFIKERKVSDLEDISNNSNQQRISIKNI